MYQVIVGLLSTIQIPHSEWRPIHVNLLINHWFQFYQWGYREYPCTRFCADQKDFHPNRGPIHYEGQRNVCRRQRICELSELNVKVFSEVVFECWKSFMDHVHIIISLDIGLFHLLLPDYWWNSSVQSFLRVVHYCGWLSFAILSLWCVTCPLES